MHALLSNSQIWLKPYMSLFLQQGQYMHNLKWKVYIYAAALPAQHTTMTSIIITVDKRLFICISKDQGYW